MASTSPASSVASSLAACARSKHLATKALGGLDGDEFLASEGLGDDRHVSFE